MRTKIALIELINLLWKNDAEIKLDKGSYSELISDAKTARNVLTNNSQVFSDTVKVDGKSAVIFELK